MFVHEASPLTVSGDEGTLIIYIIHRYVCSKKMPGLGACALVSTRGSGMSLGQTRSYQSTLAKDCHVFEQVRSTNTREDRQADG